MYTTYQTFCESTYMYMWLYREHRAHQQEGVWSTLAGGVPPVPVTRELNASTREDLEGLIQVSEE